MESGQEEKDSKLLFGTRGVAPTSAARTSVVASEIESQHRILTPLPRVIMAADGDPRQSTLSIDHLGFIGDLAGPGLDPRPAGRLDQDPGATHRQ